MNENVKALEDRIIKCFFSVFVQSNRKPFNSTRTSSKQFSIMNKNEMKHEISFVINHFARFETWRFPIILNNFPVWIMEKSQKFWICFSCLNFFFWVALWKSFCLLGDILIDVFRRHFDEFWNEFIFRLS
jgi:hypothetical protein